MIFVTWIHPLVMGLEELLLTMFREDFEFHDAAGASHHGGRAQANAAVQAEPEDASGGDIFEQMNGAVVIDAGEVVWLAAAEGELKKIPFFVRGKAKRNTEKYASDKGMASISVETLYEAKAH